MRRTTVRACLSAVLLAAVYTGGPAGADVSLVGAVPIATGLAFPAGFTFAPDGRIFYGERFSGEIRIFDPSNGSDTLFFVVPDLVTGGEQGLLGLALAPTYPARPLLYAYATRDIGPSNRNQIVTIRDVGGTGADMKVVWEGDLPAQPNHDGGRILFGPDSKLYAFTGDHLNPGNSQNLGNDIGKILRLNPNGTIPTNNPFPNSPVWSYGHRNSFGFNFDPITGFLWQTENGPACNDELNRILKRRNYGWGPNQTCGSPPPPPQNTNQDGPDPLLPQVFYTPVIAPTGLAFCVGCGIPSAEGAFLYGSFNDARIRQATLNGNRTAIVSTATVYSHGDSILSLERGPDDAVYFSDSGGIWKLVN